VKECTKSAVRRMADANFAVRYFVGNGIDIGGAPDPLTFLREFFPRMREVRVWDRADGDAQFMAGVADESFDFVHSSHCLEHLEDPAAGLKNWFRILKPGGHLIVTVPDEDLYEQGIFPSRFNPDHKATFTIYKHKSWSPRSRNLVELVIALGPRAELHRLVRLDSTFRYGLVAFDQTATPIAESGIELVVRKFSDAELAQGGRLPDSSRTLSAQGYALLTGRTIEVARQEPAPPAPPDQPAPPDVRPKRPRRSRPK
jgi:SAM-dependent methyltransferase